MSAIPDTDLSYKPLYLQVRDRLVRRLVDGGWKAGQMIPSEFDLAHEIGVSQGTVRKALDAMTADNLLVRRQGRGTYVAEPEDGRMLFQFFRLSPDDEERVFPTSRILAASLGRPTARQVAALALGPGEDVWRIDRVRFLQERPVIAETIALSAIRFDGFIELDDIPNNLYRLYSVRWGITIGRARERLKAVAATGPEAEALGCQIEAPLLSIERVALDLENRPVEWRLSRCLTDHFHYLSELR